MSAPIAFAVRDFGTAILRSVRADPPNAERSTFTTRWLAAPMITRPIENGVIAFTPDCTREEADIFVLGLNNVAIKLENQAKPPKKGKKPKEQADPDFDRFNQKPKP